MKNHIKFFLASLVIALLARLVVILFTGIYSIYEHESIGITNQLNFLEILIQSNFVLAVNTFSITKKDVFVTLIFVSLFEGFGLWATVLLGQKLKFPNFVIISIILLWAYFSHKQGLFGLNATVAFFFFSLLYFHILKRSTRPHLEAYLYSSLSHSFYNFTAFFLKHLISI